MNHNAGTKSQQCNSETDCYISDTNGVRFLSEFNTIISKYHKIINIARTIIWRVFEYFRLMSRLRNNSMYQRTGITEKL